MNYLFILFALAGICGKDLNACGQGIKGKVHWVSGNQMPSPGMDKHPLKGIKREIWIYKPTSIGQTTQSGNFYTDIKTDLVTKVMSKNDGSFKIKLPPGEYSVFVKEKAGFFANMVDGQNRINIVEVKPKEYTWLSFTVDYEAFY